MGFKSGHCAGHSLWPSGDSSSPGVTYNFSSVSCWKTILKKEGYLKILEENLKQSAAKPYIGHHFVFQHNGPKFTSFLVKNYLQKATTSPVSKKLMSWQELQQVPVGTHQNVQISHTGPMHRWAGVYPIWFWERGGVHLGLVISTWHVKNHSHLLAT